MDVLTDVLAAAKLGGSVNAHVHAAAPWGFALHEEPFAAFHAVTQGTCWLRRRGADPVQLVAGDVTLLPTGSGHALSSSATGGLVPYAQLLQTQGSPAGTDVVLSGAGPVTRLICGAYAFDPSFAQPLLTVLPPVLHLPAAQSAAHSGLSETLRMLAAELEGAEPGAKTVVDRLVDVLFVHIVRAWLATHEDEQASWLAALVDTEVAAAISCLHRDPARQWSVDSLAAEVGLSRPTLARRFTKRVGESPLAYLARWRLQLAARRLRDTSESLATVGRSVGYSSEFAFSRAFARAHGMPPGRYRAAHRSAAIPRAATPGVSVTPP